MTESWHIPRALSDKALRLLTTLPMEEIERRLRMDGPAGHERPTDEQLDDLFVEIDGSGETQSWRAFARAVLACWGAAAPAADGEVGELAAEVRYLVRELRDQADDLIPSLELFGLIHRAADLLECQALRPIPVSERLPGPSCCNALGYCWWYDHRESAWIECDVLFGQRCGYRHWLPAHALPLPEVDHE